MYKRRLKHFIKKIISSSYKSYHNELTRLENTPRYVPTTTKFQGRTIHIVDAATFLEGVDEIFHKSIYEFRSSKSKPYIIDCGANIGLSTIYFKQAYPDSKLVSFEPDPLIFECLQKNIANYSFDNISLFNKAVWSSETSLSFQCEGGYSGRIAKKGDLDNLTKVQTVRLGDFLNEDVEFVKLDIEGAETAVVKDCGDLLKNVRTMFVEYHSHINEEQDFHELLKVLSDVGFRYQIKEAYTSPKPFLQRSLMLGMDLQLNIFAYRP